MLLSDDQIVELCRDEDLIVPFETGQVKRMSGYDSSGLINWSAISYGTSSYGYDARLADTLKIFQSAHQGVLDPKNFSDDHFVNAKLHRSSQGDYFLLPPHSFSLSCTIERFRIPRGVLAICLGKSTYARCGLNVNVTPLEPEWEGQVTIEISNTTPLPARVYANEGICQFLFLKGDRDCRISYADRKGKYQYQAGVTLPRT